MPFKLRKPKVRNVSKLYRLLRISWKVQMKEFFAQSTLHGVRYVAQESRPCRERLLWFACIVVSAVTTAVIIDSLWEKFQTNPTITGLDTDFHNWKVPFPAITVCQEIPYNLSRVEESAGRWNVSRDLLMRIATSSFDRAVDAKDTPEDSSAMDRHDLKAVVLELMNTCEEVFESCEWQAYNSSCCNDFFFPVFTERGFCYTFNSRHHEHNIPGNRASPPDFEVRYIKETDLKWSIKFTVKDTTINMPIYILNSDEQVSLDVQPQHVWDYKVDKISFSVKQTYTTDDTRQLSIKQRHCVFADEIRLEIDTIYTYTGCTKQCRMENAMNFCGCVPHFYPRTKNFPHCPISQLECIFEHLPAILSVERCSCHLGCSNTVYEVEKLNEISSEEPNELEAQFVSWPMVRYKREVLFGWVDLLVSFGGIAGLFLGFSLLSGMEMVYYFTIRACCMIFRDKRELERIEKETSSKPSTDYDLSLIPYCFADPYPGNGINEVARNYHHKNPTNSKIIHVAKKGPQMILPPFGIEFLN